MRHIAGSGHQAWVLGAVEGAAVGMSGDRASPDPGVYEVG